MHSNPRTGAEASAWLTGPGSSAVDVRDILKGIWRRKVAILAITALAAAGGVGFVAVAKPEYTAQAQVLLENLETPFDRSQPNEAERRLFDESEITSQVQVLRSRDLAKRVVTDLDLVNRPGFGILPDEISLPTRVMISLGLRPDPRLMTPEQRALRKLESDVRAYQVATSRVLEIEGASEDPELAANIANAFAEVFVTSTREAQLDSTGRAREWLEDQIETLRQKVVESEAAVEAFRAEAGLIQGPTTTLSTQELAELNTQIILAEAARSEAQAKATSIRDMLARTGEVDSSSAVLGSALIQRLREQQIALQRTLAELSSTYLSNHPRIVGVRRELEDLNRQIRSEALKVVAGLEQEARIAASREEALRDSLANLKSRANENSADQVKLRSLEREAAANRTLLESFLNRFSDASARREVLAQPGMARIIARADPPSEPSFPKRGPIVLLATLAGFTIAIGLAFMAEVMRATGRPALAHEPALREPVLVREEPPAEAPAEPVAADAATEPEPELESPVEVQPEPAEAVPAAAEAVEPVPAPVMPEFGEDRPGQHWLPPLCVVQRPSAGGNGRAAVAAADLEGAFAVAMRPLVSWCMSLRQTLGVRRMALVTGDAAGADGAAGVMILVRSLAARGMRVLLMDVSGGAALLGENGEARPGLSELLSGELKFGDTIHKDAASEAHLLPAGLRRPDLLNPVNARRLDKVLEALDHAYEVVFVHLSEPLAGTGERGVVARCHAAVVFASTARSPENAVLLSELGNVGLSALQVVSFDDRQGGTSRLPHKVAVNA